MKISLLCFSIWFAWIWWLDLTSKSESHLILFVKSSICFYVLSIADEFLLVSACLMHVDVQFQCIDLDEMLRIEEEWKVEHQHQPLLCGLSYLHLLSMSAVIWTLTSCVLSFLTLKILTSGRYRPYNWAHTL